MTKYELETETPSVGRLVQEVTFSAGSPGACNTCRNTCTVRPAILDAFLFKKRKKRKMSAEI